MRRGKKGNVDGLACILSVSETRYKQPLVKIARMLLVDQRVSKLFDVTKCDAVCAIVFSFVVRQIRPSLRLSLCVPYYISEGRKTRNFGN